MTDEDEYDFGPDEDDEIVDVPTAEYTIYYSDGEWFGKDEHGRFRLMQGDRRPKSEHDDDYNYETCGATLRHSFERYGEKRYCTAMAVSNFTNVTDEYDYPEFCKKHQERGNLMEHHQDCAKHLAFVESYENIFEYLSAHEQIFAVETFRSLLEESVYDFDTEPHDIDLSADDSDLFDDDAAIEMPIPTEHVSRAKALWFASLDYVRMENILEEQFRTAAEESGPEGEPLTVGERTTVVSVTDDGRVIEDKDEHHLNLPLSRIQKDYERHLDVGGVDSETEDDVGEEEARVWVTSVEDSRSSGGPSAEFDDG